MTKSDSAKAATPKKSKPFLPKICTSILFLIIGVISASYLSTQTLDFNGQFAKIQKFIKYNLMNNANEVVLTPEQLAEHDGSDPEKPIYLAIKGRVYDVSAGAQYYGKVRFYLRRAEDILILLDETLHELTQRVVLEQIPAILHMIYGVWMKAKSRLKMLM
jgi:predicted heme/steroid binding protein